MKEDREYSAEWNPGEEPYYPINDEKNGEFYRKYRTLADKETKTLFGGRLGEYKYYDMDVVIASALRCAKAELSKKHIFPLSSAFSNPAGIFLDK